MAASNAAQTYSENEAVRRRVMRRALGSGRAGSSVATDAGTAAAVPTAISSPADLLGLQRSVGNRAVNRLLATPHAAQKQTERPQPASLSVAARQVQRKAVQSVTSVGLFRDVGNGLFGSDTPVTANDVLALVRAIRASDTANDSRTNIKILTGTHGSAQGHLIGEPVFYQEDLQNEGHKGTGGWTNVLNVRNRSKDTVAGWKDSRDNTAIILAWCYSATSEANWPTVNATWDNGATWVW
jgi:hypothetical protein